MDGDGHSPLSVYHDFNKSMLNERHNKAREELHRHESTAAAEGKTILFESFIQSSLPSVPLDGLHPISLPELFINVIHTGRVLFGKLCVDPLKIAGIVTCLEDENGLAVRLSIYNAVLSSSTIADVQRVFPKGLEIAVKEPYLKRAQDGMLIVRVDNPANVERLEKRPDTGILESPKVLGKLWKMGKREFEKQACNEAKDLYTKCIEGALKHLKHEEAGRCLLWRAYSDRAETWMKLKKYKQSLADSEHALELDCNDLRSLLRKGKALRCLQWYKQAYSFLLAAQERYPENKEIEAALQESLRCQRQSEQGDFGGVEQFLLNDGEPPKCCDYIGPVVVKMAGNGRGRGLFVTRCVQAGDLLLVSNPLAIHKRNNENTFFRLNMNSQNGNTSSEEDLVTSLVSLAMSSSGHILSQLYCLAGGSFSVEVPSMESFQPDGVFDANEASLKSFMELDMQQIRQIVKLNSFHSGSSLFQARNTIMENGFLGLWLLPSFINHSCLPNATTLKVGDAMFIHAACSLQEGMEITISYCDVFLPLREREEACRDLGFRCTCMRCNAERSFRKPFEQISSRFRQLRTRAEEEVADALRWMFPTNLTECGMFGELTVEVEKEINRLELSGAVKEWIRASFSSAYTARLQYGMDGGDGAELELCPSVEELIGAMNRTAPGDLRTLSLIKWFLPSTSRERAAKDACISALGKWEPSILEALVQKYSTTPPFP